MSKKDPELWNRAQIYVKILSGELSFASEDYIDQQNEEIFLEKLKVDISRFAKYITYLIVNFLAVFCNEVIIRG